MPLPLKKPQTHHADPETIKSLIAGFEYLIGCPFTYFIENHPVPLPSKSPQEQAAVPKMFNGLIVGGLYFN